MFWTFRTASSYLVHRPLFTALCSPFTALCSLFTDHCLLLSVHRSLLTAEFKKEIGHTT